MSLEQGDGTSTMLNWAAANAADQGPVEGSIVPGDDGLLAAMPQLLQREYSFPFLEGRLFVDRLRESGGWNAVNGAWAAPPASTEQVLHPATYPAEVPIPVALDGLAGRLGGALGRGLAADDGRAAHRRLAGGRPAGHAGRSHGRRSTCRAPTPRQAGPATASSA